MPNTHNRFAFRAVAVDKNAPLLSRAYCALVLVELALKDRLALPNLGHDLPSMLQRLAQQNQAQRAALNQHRCELSNKLMALHVNAVNGNATRVRASAFPDLRYLRHTTDCGLDASDDLDLDQLRICVDKIRAFLKTNLEFKQPI